MIEARVGTRSAPLKGGICMGTHLSVSASAIAVFAGDRLQRT